MREYESKHVYGGSIETGDMGLIINQTGTLLAKYAQEFDQGVLPPNTPAKNLPWFSLRPAPHQQNAPEHNDQSSRSFVGIEFRWVPWIG